MSDDPLPFSVQATPTDITIHVPDSHLGEFITRLLGQPQNIRKTFPAIFQLDHSWFNNLHYLLTQHISQQHRHELIQFSAKIYFEDGLVRTLNSAEAFTSFAEVQPIKSIGCRMTWTFLLSFASKSAPEKQQIRVTVMSQFRGNLAYEDFILPPDLQTGHIELEIDHTERTWGDDIMSMLLGYVNSHVTHLGKVRDWMCTNAIKICFALAMMCLITGSWLSFRLSNDIPAELQSLIANRELLPNNIETISQKINWLLVLGTRQSQDFYPAIILVLTIIAFFVCLIYLPRLIRSLPASFVIFSAKTQEHMANQDKTHARRRIIGDSLLLGTVASLIASWIWSLMNLV